MGFPHSWQVEVPDIVSLHALLAFAFNAIEQSLFSIITAPFDLSIITKNPFVRY
jgi:hypothetical protein